MYSIGHFFFKAFHERKICNQIHLRMFHSVFIILKTTMRISILNALRSPTDLRSKENCLSKSPEGFFKLLWPQERFCMFPIAITPTPHNQVSTSVFYLCIWSYFIYALSKTLALKIIVYGCNLVFAKHFRYLRCGRLSFQRRLADNTEAVDACSSSH